MSESTRTAHREPVGADKAGPLHISEVTDTADTSPRAVSNLKGRRLRAIPYAGGTTIVVSQADFRANGISHPTVTFDFRKDHFTLPVDPPKGQAGVSKEAAEFLATNHPNQFEFMNA